MSPVYTLTVEDDRGVVQRAPSSKRVCMPLGPRSPMPFTRSATERPLRSPTSPTERLRRMTSALFRPPRDASLPPLAAPHQNAERDESSIAPQNPPASVSPPDPAAVSPVSVATAAAAAPTLPLLITPSSPLFDDAASMISGISFLPAPPSPDRARQAHIAKLRRHLGEDVPPELVLDTRAIVAGPSTATLAPPTPSGSQPASASSSHPSASFGGMHSKTVRRLKSFDLGTLGRSPKPEEAPTSPTRRPMPAGGPAPRSHTVYEVSETQWLKSGTRPSLPRPMTKAEKVQLVKRAKKMNEVGNVSLTLTVAGSLMQFVCITGLWRGPFTCALPHRQPGSAD
jgi:hypothetical protein